MPVENSPPARQTRSQAVLIPTPRVPLDGTSAIPQLRAHLDRGPITRENFTSIVGNLLQFKKDKIQSHIKKMASTCHPLVLH
ncbi:hypothetical protein O181_006172 [Austropuccinia psidii MF-1]|uniref:Uncharacterized protein n=1 Tax=Austropuccinia psidii MF-1 TaxID=1389203 RepID=A0A9Q3BK84_9BASI|nr:hypothetical protein [Austropuccinia psidii MF-1]